MRGELGEARASWGAGDVARRGFEPTLEAAHVPDADRVLEEGEHRRIVRRIADEGVVGVHAPEVGAEALGEEPLGGLELVAVASYTVGQSRWIKEN